MDCSDMHHEFHNVNLKTLLDKRSENRHFLVGKCLDSCMAVMSRDRLRNEQNMHC